MPRRSAVPYGYRRIDDAQGNYVTRLPVEPQASVVREIISRAAQGQAIAGILRELESRGVPAPRGGPRWSWTVVHDIHVFRPWSRRSADYRRRSGMPPNRATSGFLLPLRATVASKQVRGPCGVSMVALKMRPIFAAVEPCLPARVLSMELSMTQRRRLSR